MYHIIRWILLLPMSPTGQKHQHQEHHQETHKGTDDDNNSGC